MLLNAKHWAAKNPDKYRANQQRHYARNREDRLQYALEYQREHYPDRRQTRRAMELRAIPPWANLEKIREIYRNRPPGYHVDHIIPLTAKENGRHIACGLHCEANLQYLPSTDNHSKGSALEAA
jgi:thioesterase domain-containing protein